MKKPHHSNCLYYHNQKSSLSDRQVIYELMLCESCIGFELCKLRTLDEISARDSNVVFQASLRSFQNRLESFAKKDPSLGSVLTRVKAELVKSINCYGFHYGISGESHELEWLENHLPSMSGLDKDKVRQGILARIDHIKRDLAHFADLASFCLSKREEIQGEHFRFHSALAVTEGQISHYQRECNREIERLQKVLLALGT